MAVRKPPPRPPARRRRRRVSWSFLQKVAATLRFPGRGDDAVSFAKDPTVTITRDSTGAAVVTAAATTKVDAGEGDIEHYTVDLTGAQVSEIDLLTATWTDGNSSYTTHHEVVGGFLCSLTAIKEKMGVSGDDEEISTMRALVSRSIESACGVAFRPRYAKDVLNGSGTKQLMLRHPRLLRVLAASVDGEALDGEALEALTLDPAGFLISETCWPEGQANVEVSYAHGYESFGPAALPVRDLAAYWLTGDPTDWNERATSHTTDLGTYSLVVPGMRGASFPLPAVNAFVDDHRYVSVG